MAIVRRVVKKHGGTARGFLGKPLVILFPTAGYLTPADRLEDAIFELEQDHGGRWKAGQ